MAVKEGAIHPTEELKMVDEVGTEGSGMSTEQMKTALADERNKRIQAAASEIQSTLQRYSVSIDPICVIQGGKIFTDIRIVPVE